GVWVFRQGPLRFALPITTGTIPGVADYLPAPHGLGGFAVPVEQTVPALVPYLELADGRAIVATDGGADIQPGADGKSLHVTWKRWAVLGQKPAQFVDPGLTTTVNWTIQGSTLVRSESILTSKPLTIRRLYVDFPATARTVTTSFESGHRIDR